MLFSSPTISFPWWFSSWNLSHLRGFRRYLWTYIGWCCLVVALRRRRLCITLYLTVLPSANGCQDANTYCQLLRYTIVLWTVSFHSRNVSNMERPTDWKGLVQRTQHASNLGALNTPNSNQFPTNIDHPFHTCSYHFQVFLLRESSILRHMPMCCLQALFQHWWPWTKQALFSIHRR